MPSFKDITGVIVTFIILSVASAHGEWVWKGITEVRYHASTQANKKPKNQGRPGRGHYSSKIFLHAQRNRSSISATLGDRNILSGSNPHSQNGSMALHDDKWNLARNIRALFAYSCPSLSECYIHGVGSNLQKVSNVIWLFNTEKCSTLGCFDAWCRKRR